MKKQILGFALLFALSTNLHAQTTDSTVKMKDPAGTNGSNSTYGNNGNNNTLDTTSSNSGINNNSTPIAPDGMKSDSLLNTKKRPPHKGAATKPQNSTTPQ